MNMCLKPSSYFSTFKLFVSPTMYWHVTAGLLYMLLYKLKSYMIIHVGKK